MFMFVASVKVLRLSRADAMVPIKYEKRIYRVHLAEAPLIR